MPEYLAPGVYIEETSFRSKSIEGVSNEQVGAQILTLQTQLQASLQTTALLSKLSIVNFIPA